MASSNAAIAAASTVGVQNEREIQPMQLPLDQLSQLKTQHEEELGELSRQLQALHDAQGRFLNAKSVLKDMCTNPVDSLVLVPLNTSLYVPGKITDKENVIVELGTGYFAEKSEKEAQALIERKLTLVQKSIESVESIAKGKSKTLEQLVQIMVSSPCST
jgi:prefoldin alpha subunit